ncbi:hypothetical protein ABZ929_05450 [Streptomyces physcomitrii]|uniref:Uncharacterized protein n=1 Tax=Streptomyces albus (strain ATCC 21838 / DSM 41398 / FERM P-419 / JCM 4703 / NBRC 107858) TaxID=1081613 RepID=A0A0B5EZV1_STRA4|nr:hypothetical protein [Streptomyces sp. SCSIO ZS0520]AJE83607.1 hypothetical protein SLNWT_3231 [Streptomyces albus]AOU77914.1 hypothetical protein SLNHY_3223 [Streptomyces albus]AYN33669.1 hypothetical protein DUI70_3168 [Streptomyces albus]
MSPPATTDTPWHRTPVPSDCLEKPHIAAALAEDTLVRRLDSGGVEGVLHEAPDHSRAVLGLHNPTSAEARINLDALLPERADCTWHFLSGSMHTSHATDGMYVHLPVSGTVWLTAAS